MADDDQARAQSRLREFKNVNKGKDEWKNRRNTSSSTQRANKRENQISKRRHAFNAESSPSGGVDVSQLATYIQMMNSDDHATVHEGVKSIRLLMCVKKDPPIKEAVNARVHWKLVSFLDKFDYPDIQFDAAWALTNIGSGDSEDTRSVVEAGSVPPLVRLLKSPVDKVRVQATWALGNISGESHECRDMVLREGAMQSLLELLWNAMNSLDNYAGGANNAQDHELLSTGTWAISNFVRGDKSGSDYYQLIEGAVDFLARIINYSDDHPTLADACWALSYLTDSDSVRIQKVVEAAVTTRLVKLMDYKSTMVVAPALRTIGNIVTGNDIQTNVVLQCDALSALDNLLESENDMIRKESAWAMSNIFAGTVEQVKKPLEEVDDGNGNKVPRYQIVTKLLSMMMSDSHPKARKEAAWAITNLITNGKPEDMQLVMIDYDGLRAIMSFLKMDVLNLGQIRNKGNTKSAETMGHLAHNILTALHQTVLPAGANMGYDYNIFSQRIQEVAGTDVFEQLALFPVVQTGKLKTMPLPTLASEILVTFFPEAADQATEYNNANHGVNANGEMEFNPNLQAGGIQL